MRRLLPIITLVLVCTALHAQAPPLSDAERQAVLDALVEQIEAVYVFPDSVARVRSFLEARTVSGAYDGLAAPALGVQLTDDLRGFTHDRHFAVVYDSDRYREWEALFAAADADDVPADPVQIDPASRMAARYRRANYFLRAAEVLDGNVGYLKIDQMPPLDLARPTLDAAMAFLANTDALVLDVRGAPGGVGGFIPYLMSYVLPPDFLLFSRDFGAADSVATFFTHATIGGERRLDVPLYVLTDGFTGSAAENLAYTLQQHGRATVVGAVSAGAAHSARGVLLTDGFTAAIPTARVVHPVSESNWEGVGVQPDVVASSEEALGVAHRLALDTVLKRKRRSAFALEAARRAAEVGTAADDAMPDEGLDEYVGTYGVRRIFVEDGALRLQREGGPPLPLRRIEGDHFAFDLPPGMRAARPLPDVHVRRDENGRIVGLAFIQSDGSVEEEVARDG